MRAKGTQSNIRSPFSGDASDEQGWSMAVVAAVLRRWWRCCFNFKPLFCLTTHKLSEKLAHVARTSEEC